MKKLFLILLHTRLSSLRGARNERQSNLTYSNEIASPPKRRIAMTKLQIGMFLKIPLLCFFYSGFAIQALSQGNYPITIQVQLTPPYSAYISDYKYKPIISFTNHSQMSLDVYIRGRIENDRGQYIQTAPNVFSNIPIHVPGMQTVVVQGNQLDESYLNLNNLQTNLDNKSYSNLFQLGMIPEGFYTFCIYAYVRNGNGNYVPVSDPQGPGACFAYNVGYVTPPHILNPLPGDKILPSPNQNVNISWTRPVGNMQGASLVYDLYLVKVLPGQNPNVSLNNAVQYGAGLFLKQSNIPINNFQFTNLTTFHLDEGSQYALMVQAKDLTGKTAFENNGRSEMQVFQYGIPHITANESPVLSILSPSKDKDTLIISSGNDLYVNWGWLLNNKLFDPDTLTVFKNKDITSYRITMLPAQHKKSGRDIDDNFSYKASKKVTASPQKVALAYWQKTLNELQNAGVKDHYWYHFKVEALNSNNQIVSNTESRDFCLLFENLLTGPAVTVKGQLRYQFDGYKENYPIPNTSVRFYPASEKPAGSEGITALTDATGYFEINIPVKKNGSYKLEIESPYYHQPDTVLNIPDAETSLQLGQLITKVFNYSLTLNVEKRFGNYVVTERDAFHSKAREVTIGIPDSLIKEIPAGLQVMIYRKKKPAFLPPKEGDMISPAINADGNIPVSEGKTAIRIDKDGKQQAYVKFDRLICNMLPGDIYYIKAFKTNPKNKGGNPKVFEEEPFTAPEQELVFEKPVAADTTHFDVDSLYTLISTDPPKSVITGRLVYQWPGDPNKTLRPLAHEKFSIVVEYLFNGKIVSPTLPTKDGIIMTGLRLDGDIHPISGNSGTVMATGTTDENGYFSIQAVNLNTKGELGKGTYGENHIPMNLKETNQQIIISPQTRVAGKVLQQDYGNVMNQNDDGILNYPGNIGAIFDLSHQINNLNNAMNPGMLGGKMNAGFQLVGQINNNNKTPAATEGMLAKGHGPFYMPESLFTNQVAENNLLTGNDADNIFAEEGTIQRVYRIRLNDQHLYYNPVKNIVVQPLQATDAGQITVMVKEVKWDITAEDASTGNKLPELKAIVFRDPASKISNLPITEGDGRYRMNKLINPQFDIDANEGNPSLKGNYSKVTTNRLNNVVSQQVSFAVKPQQKGKYAEIASTNVNAGSTIQYNQWAINKQSNRNGEDFQKGSSPIPQGSFEWLEDSTTNSTGHIIFTRLLGGFPDYYAEFASNPQTGQTFFYQARFPSLNPDGNSVTYVNNFSPSNNSRYGNYWDMRKTDIPVAQMTVKMTPKPSRVGGRVIDKSTGLGIPNAVVYIQCKNDTPYYNYTYFKTDKDGYFELLSPFDGVSSNVSNIDISLSAWASGYKPGEEKSGTVSRTGTQYIDNLLLEPASRIIGKVTDEQGEPVDAYIKRSDGKVVSTWEPYGMAWWRIYSNYTKLISNKNSYNTQGGFNINVPNNKPVTLYIIPKDVGYFPDTITLSYVKDGVTDLGNKIVFRRKHRMKFVIKDSTTNQPIPNTKLYISKTQHTITDASGTGIFNYENVSVDNYMLKITGPEEQGYVPRLISLHNRESKNQHTYSIKLYKGASVSGVVTLDGKPVAQAKVYLDYNTVSSKDALPEIATYSNAAGHYTLNGIPVTNGTAHIIATLDTTFTVEGDKETVALTGSGTVQNLSLKSYHQMLIKTLYGFPLSVEKIEPGKKDGQVIVSGKVNISKGISDFGFLTGSNKNISVSNILFEAKQINGKKVGVPLAPEVNMDAVASIKLSYKDKYNVLLTANGQNTTIPQLLQISEDQAAEGTINGFINIVDNSFNYPSTYLNFTDKDQFYFCKIKDVQIENKLQVIRTSGKTTNLPYHLCNFSKKPIQFNFIEFDATANPLNSYIDNEGKIHLDVSLKCYIPHAQPEHFDLHAGDIVLDNNKVYPGSDTAALRVKLEEWTLLVRHWKIDPQQGGIYSTDGLIKTGKVDIPFSEFNLRPDMFVIDKFDLEKIELGGGVKQLDDIDSKNTLIVYDTRTGSDMSGHWKVAIAGTAKRPAAKIKNLSFNGRQYLNRDVNIKYIELLSNGENILTLQQTNSPFLINQNGVAQFSPQSISSGPDFFEITGGLHIPAPRVVPFMTTLQFTGTPAALKMKILPVQMSFEGKGYVNFFADEKIAPVITNNQIVMKGNVQEKDGFNPIKATFYADGNNPDNAFYHVDLKKDFILNLTSNSSDGGTQGKYNLKLNAGGGMEVPKGANDWDLLSFSGHLLTNDNTLNANGGKGNNMTFTVMGDVSVEGDSAKVSNINLPFGRMHMAYIFPKKRLVGNLHVDSIKLGTFQISGDVEMQMEPAGWYFLGSCLIKTGIPGPFSTLNMGFLLGNHGFAGADWDKIQSTVAQYSYDKSSLCWLRNNGSHAIKGVFITAGKELINQSLGVNIAVASFYLKARAGGEASLYASFNPSWEVQMSAGLYGDVAAGATALGVSVDGRLIVKGSMTSAAGIEEVCLGGKISASLSAQGKVSIPPAQDITFGPITENAVLKLVLSNVSGVSTDFYFGEAPPPTCSGKSACSN